MENKDIEVLKTTDFTDFEEKAIQEYEEAGLPGIASVEDSVLLNMMELYLGGKTYREISKITRRPKNVVLYLSKKFGWYPKRVEYLRDIQENVIQRTLEARLVGQDFLLQIKHFFERKIGKKITKYLESNSEADGDAIDLKEIDKYIKTFETIDNLSAFKRSKDSGSNPTVGLNVGDGVTIKKTGENTVEVTPKQKAIGDMLKELADFRRDESVRNDSVKEKKRNENEE